MVNEAINGRPASRMVLSEPEPLTDGRVSRHGPTRLNAAE